MQPPDLRLLHITDTHLHADPDARLRGVATRATLDKVIGSMMASGRPAHALLATGDLSQDETPESYVLFREMLGRLRLPLWCLPGNHDAPAVMARELAPPAATLGGAQRHGAWSVILLDSHAPGDHGGRLSDETLAWLEETLATERDRHVLLAIHHAPLPLGSRWLDELGLRNATALLDIIDRAAQVRAVLAGHVHQASDVVRNDVRYLTTPSTCFQFLPGSDAFVIDRRPPGWRWLDLMPDGRIDTGVVWIDPA